MHSSRLLSFVLASLFVAPSLGVTLTQVSQLTTTTFDYVIVGGGNAGLVVASRLSEDPNVSVLVLEAGVSDQGVIPAEAPFLGPTLTPNTPYDWNYTVVPQAGMQGRTFAYPRGRLLGGSSSANYLFHQYGTNEDWSRLSSASGDSGWLWSNMKKYIQKHEKFVPPVDGHNTTGQFIPSLHGFNGEVSTSLPGYNQTIDPRVLATTKQLAEFPYNQDMSGGDQSLLGIGFLQSSAGGGVRSSSSTSYLANANKRPNLTVIINATVMKLIQTGTTSKGLKSFRSVQFGSSLGTASTPASTSSKIVTARKEVILSAGSIGTTQILQLSGIGKASDLAALRIPSTINNPSVGDNLSDHTLLPNIFSVKGTQSFDGFLRDPNQVNAAVEQWVTNKTGMFANNVVNNFGFARIPSNATIFKVAADPAAGPNSPHWEIIISNFWFNPGIPQPTTGSFMTIVAVLISPSSRGTVKLASNNPFDKPLIDPNYLTTQFDIFTMREAVKAIKRFVAAPAWSDYVIGPFGDVFSKASTDAQIENYVRGLTTTIFHPVGTASMTPANAKTGVVNPDLTVKGADGLRIVDASVFPFVPSSHTQGPVYLLAERASDIIKAAN
ncbi:hypothetical protein GALMADRAFT_223476 [Galerina marginata CBS 339.88]|uniref:pyranose dehydrogenase (acceptor) n=1 Tax=Galerina marginata (strain CBS 339.88) TaxID=685588 RepID=A0A067TH42_GALM3|nr:hypothetical protein GALMADRAFT_223476 [Galerina marginata CBS 339.88]